MAGVTVVHTSGADPATLRAARALCGESFDSFDDVDWDHALGGLHAFLHDGNRLVAHGSVVQRRFLVRDPDTPRRSVPAAASGRSLRCGYVEAVAVAADRRRQGLGTAVMAELERIVRAGYPFGALSSSEAGARLYAARGWQLWQGPVAVLAPYGTVPTPEEHGSVFVLPGAAALDLDGELICDWRDGDLW
jgi:aminoglycoside 2'-N-acetyltransferase I